MRLEAPARKAALTGAATGKVELLELAAGIEIRTTSWVGHLAFGRLQVTIEPKVSGAVLADLLRYGYGLRDLRLASETDQPIPAGGIQDLLAWQLAAEAEELLARGLHRDYRLHRERMASPRGRLDMGALATGGPLQTTLPCIHHPRNEHNAINRALRGALVLAARLTQDERLRHRALRLAMRIDADAFLEEVDAGQLQALGRIRDRRLAAYEPALQIGGLLLEGRGASLEESTAGAILPGFAFDMNAFFQRLLSRLIRDGLPDHDLLDEHGIQQLFGWTASGNPRGRKNPTPRPDFTLQHGGCTVAVLDAKYKDLWEHALPPDMLYQLTLYALAHPSAGSRATILYPTLADDAVDQSVELRDPAGGLPLARVMLRPVHLRKLRGTVSRVGENGGPDRRDAMARRLVFGGTAIGK